MRASIDHASSHGEEQCANHAVRKHLQHRSRDAERVGRGQAEQHKAHVAHARIADDKFQIALTQRHRCSVNDSDYREDSDPAAPHLEALREKVHCDAEPGVGAQFHDDAGEQH